MPNGGPDVAFLKALKIFVDKQIKAGRKLVIVSGGGKTARHYIEAASQVRTIVDEDLDWLGIHATRLNGRCKRSHPGSQKMERADSRGRRLETGLEYGLCGLSNCQASGC